VPFGRRRAFLPGAQNQEVVSDGPLGNEWLTSGSPTIGQFARKMAPMAMRVTEMGASEGCPVIGQIEVASPRGDKITSPETELTSCWCSARELLRNRRMKQRK
jgi:hypothetical protein